MTALSAGVLVSKCHEAIVYLDDAGNVEYENQPDLEEALAHGLQCAKERYIGIRFGLKDKDAHGPKIEVRTARMRPRKAASL